MKRRKKILAEMTDDELVDYGVKHNKRYLIAKNAKWVVCGAHVLLTLLLPESVLMPLALSSISAIHLWGILQVINADDVNKCKKILKSRGTLYKLTEKIENNRVQENEVGRRVSQVGKDEIINEVGDVFPEFSDNSSYTYRKELVKPKQNNDSERGS